MTTKLIVGGLGLLSLLAAASALSQQNTPPLPASTKSLPVSPPVTVEEPKTVFLRLKHANAAETSNTVQNLMRDQVSSVNIAANESSNMIILRGDPRSVVLLQELILEIDTEPTNPKASANSAAGGPRATSVAMNEAKLPAARALTERESKLLRELSGLEAQATSTAKAYRTAAAAPARDDKSLSDVRERLEKVVEQAFDKRQEVQELEIKQLKERMAKIEATMSKRTERKKEIVSKRVGELLDDPELRWDTGANSSLLVPSLPTAPRIVPGLTSLPVAPSARSTDSEGSAGWSLRWNLLQAQQDVASSEARLKDAEAVFARKAMSKSEYEAAKQLATLARQRLDLARQEFDVQRTLLQLDVASASAGVDVAAAELSAAEETNRRAPNAVPNPQFAKLRGALEQADVQLRRAKTLLDLHKSMDPKPATPSGPTTPASAAPSVQR